MDSLNLPPRLSTMRDSSLRIYDDPQTRNSIALPLPIRAVEDVSLQHEKRERNFVPLISIYECTIGPVWASNVRFTVLA